MAECISDKKKEDGIVFENQTNYVCRLQSKNDNQEVFIYKCEDAEDLLVGQAFLVKRGMPNIDFQRLLTEINQYFYTEDDMSNIEMESRYIIEIPIEYETQVEAEGTIFNKEDSTLDNFNRKQVEKAGNYKYSKKPLVKGQTLFNSKMILDIAKGCYNFATKQQIRQLSKEIEKTYDAVRSIEKGQMDDRVACLKSGREQVLVALALKDEDEQRRAISIARSDMMTAKHQIGLHLKRKCEEFKPVSGNTLIRFFSGIMESGYLRNKDSEVYDLQQYYKFFLEATELLAASYLITNEEEAAKLVFQGSIDFLKDIDFSNVKSIAYTKKREDQFWFYDKAIAHFKTEQKHFLENTRRYESIAVEVMGKELWEIARS